MILAVANDARLAGRQAVIEPSELIAVTDYLLRVGCLLGHIRSMPEEDSSIESRPDLELIRNTYAPWLPHLRAVTDGQVEGRPPLRTMVLAANRGDSSAPGRGIELPALDGQAAQTLQASKPGRRLAELTSALEYHLTRVARQNG